MSFYCDGKTDLALKYGLLGWRKEIIPENAKEIIRWLQEKYNVLISWRDNTVFLYLGQDLLMIYTGFKEKYLCDYIVDTILPDVLKLWWTSGDIINGPSISNFENPKEWT